MRFEYALVETTRAKTRRETPRPGQNQPLIMQNQTNMRVFRLKAACHCAAPNNVEKMADFVGFRSVSSRLGNAEALIYTTND